MTVYSDSFFREIASNSKIGAQRILPLLWTQLRPRSVVELGCGTGEWLLEAQRLGADRVFGLDGAWVPADRLVIPAKDFNAVDLERDELATPSERYDLAICLEVLEHVAEEHCDRLIAWLCRQAPAVLFSAAIPWQPGTSHINSAWQSAWARKFAAQDFLVYDFIRTALWSDKEIPYYYRQNIFIAAEPNHEALREMRPVDPSALDVVHPEFFTIQMQKHDRKRERLLKNRFRKFRTRLGKMVFGSAQK